jgi:hypothetical protein
MAFLKSKFLPRRFSALFTTTFLLATLLFLTGSDKSGEIRVIEAKGPPAAIIMADGSTPPVRVGDLVPLGSTLKTPADSTLKLLFANGAILILQPRSQLRLALFASKDSLQPQHTALPRPAEQSKSHTDLDLQSGAVLLDVPPLKKDSKFQVTTPLGTAALRGTRFYVSVRNKRAAVGVAEGLVVTTSLIGQTQMLAAGQAIALSAKGLERATAGEVSYIRNLDAAFGTTRQLLKPTPATTTPKSSAGYQVSE